MNTHQTHGWADGRTSLDRGDCESDGVVKGASIKSPPQCYIHTHKINIPTCRKRCSGV